MSTEEVIAVTDFVEGGGSGGENSTAAPEEVPNAEANQNETSLSEEPVIQSTISPPQEVVTVPVVEPLKHIPNLRVLVASKEFLFPVSESANSQTVRWLATAAVQKCALYDAANTGSRSSMRIGATNSLPLAVPYGVVLESTGELVSPTLTLFELHRRIMGEREHTSGELIDVFTATIVAKKNGHLGDRLRVLLTEKELIEASRVKISSLIQGGGGGGGVQHNTSESKSDASSSVLDGGVRSLWQAAAFSGSTVGRHMTRQHALAAKMTTMESEAVFRIMVKQRRIEDCFHVINRLHALCAVEGPVVDYAGVGTVMTSFWSLLRFSELTRACEMAGSGLQRKRDEYPLKMNLVASFPHIIRLLHHFGEGGGDDGLGGENGDLFTMQHHEWIHFLSTLKIIPREVTLDKANSIFEQCCVTYKEEYERAASRPSQINTGGSAKHHNHHHHHHQESTAVSSPKGGKVVGGVSKQAVIAHPPESDKAEPCLTFSECIEAFIRVAIDCHAHEVDSSNGQRSTIQRCLDRFLTSHALHFSFKLLTGKLNRSLYDSSFRHWLNSNNRLNSIRKVFAYYAAEKAEVQEYIKRDEYGKGLHLPAQRNSLKFRSFLTILVHAGLAPAILLGTPEQQKKEADQNKGRKLPPGTPEPLTIKDVRQAFFGAQLLNDSANHEDEIIAKDREDDPWQRLVFWGFFEAIARISIQKWSAAAGIADSNPNTTDDELQRVSHVLLKDHKTVIDHLLKDHPIIKENGEKHFRDPHHHEHHLQLHRALHAASHVALSVLHPPEAHISGKDGKPDPHGEPQKHVDNRNTRRGSIIFGDIVAIHHGRTEHGDHSHSSGPSDKHFFGRHHDKMDDASVHGLSQADLLEKLRLERIEAFKVIAQRKSDDILNTLKTVDTSKPLPDAQNEVFRTFIHWAMDAVIKLASHLGEPSSPIVHSVSDLVVLSNTYAISTRATLDDNTLKRPTTVAASGMSSPTPILSLESESKVSSSNNKTNLSRNKDNEKQVVDLHVGESEAQQRQREYEEMAKRIATDLSDDGTHGVNKSGTDLHTTDPNISPISSSSLSSSSSSQPVATKKTSETLNNRARRNSLIAGALPAPNLFPVEVSDTHITGIQSPSKNSKGFLDPEVDLVSRGSPIKAAFNFKMKTSDPMTKEPISSPARKKNSLFNV